MNIWQERFQPSRIMPFEPKSADFNAAWNWMFERDESGEFIRAGLCLIVIHEQSLKLRKSGVRQSAQVAAIGIWRRYAVSSLKMPLRAF
jgi:hypothetical protein